MLNLSKPNNSKKSKISFLQPHLNRTWKPERVSANVHVQLRISRAYDTAWKCASEQDLVFRMR